MGDVARDDDGDKGDDSDDDAWYDMMVAASSKEIDEDESANEDEAVPQPSNFATEEGWCQAMIEQSSMSAVVAEEDSPVWMGFARLSTVSFDDSEEPLPNSSSLEGFLSSLAQSQENGSTNDEPKAS